MSGGARFFIGALAGNSDVKIKLVLTDSATNEVIGSPIISKQSGAMSGAWSMGSTGRNLVDYIIDISERYLTNNY